MWWLWYASIRRWHFTSYLNGKRIPHAKVGVGGGAFQLEQKSSGKSKQGVFMEEKEGQCSCSINIRRKSG